MGIVREVDIGMTDEEAIFIGDSVEIQCTVYDTHTAAGDSSDSAKDISGATAEFRVAKKQDGNSLLTKTTSDDISMPDAPNGVLKVSLGDADIVEALKGDNFYTISVTLNGQTVTVMYGKMRVRQRPAA